MQLIQPDVVAEARSLSKAFLGTGLGVGALLWLTGWWGHRFWIVLFATVSAGLFGLHHGPAALPPAVAGVLMAIGAGVLALNLVRVVAFAAGGFVVWLLAQSGVTAPWNEPLICGLAGGLAGLLLFRLWTMALTSFLGGTLAVYFGLCLADRLDKLNAVDWAEGKGQLLNGVVAGMALIGLMLQFGLDRRAGRKERERLEMEAQQTQQALRKLYERRWWNWGHGYRRAG